MKGKHSLKKTGLSLSQAQSISNLCNQKSTEINRELNNINNFSREIKMPDGELLSQVESKPLSSNLVESLIAKSKYHALQAFLMENIKEKDNLLKEAFSLKFQEPESIKKPAYPTYAEPNEQYHVDETWGWNQLTEAEYQEYLEAEAYAAHIGQFIHKNGRLDYLRNELTTTDLLQWIDIQDGVKSPVILKPHHTPEQLMELFEELSGIHRKYEQRVNYFKAKVMNLVNDRNATISSENAKLVEAANKENEILRTQYKAEVQDYHAKVTALQHKFEAEKEKTIKEISQLRISIPERFKGMVDEMLSTLE